MERERQAQQLLDIIEGKFAILANEPNKATKDFTWKALIGLRRQAKALTPSKFAIFRQLYNKLRDTSQYYAELCDELDEIWKFYEGQSAWQKRLAAQAMQNSPPSQPANQTYGLQPASHGVHGVPTGGHQNPSVQFAPAMGGGTNTSSAQHAHPGGPIWTWDQMNQVDRQVEAEFRRGIVAPQGPARFETGQYTQPGLLPEGQHFLPPPPRSAQHLQQSQSAWGHHGQQTQAATQAYPGPSHARSQSNISQFTAGTFGGTPPTFLPLSSEAGPSEFYDRQGYSLDSDGYATARTSGSSERNYQY